MIFTFQTPSLADDIRDFQIEGMSIGDSLLDHAETIGVTKKFIKNYDFLYYPKSKKYSTIAILNRGNYTTYYKVQFTIDPKNFKIYKISGSLKVSSKNDCIRKQKEIVEDLIKTDKSLKKIVEEFTKHPIDKTGESIANGVYLDFPSEDSIDVECYIWGKTYKQEKGSEDSLKVSLSTRIITDFLIYEAY